jgi:hypothetical protein
MDSMDSPVEAPGMRVGWISSEVEPTAFESMSPVAANVTQRSNRSGFGCSVLSQQNDTGWVAAERNEISRKKADEWPSLMSARVTVLVSAWMIPDTVCHPSIDGGDSDKPPDVVLDLTWKF